MSEVNHGIAHSLRFNQDHLALIKPPELFRGLSLPLSVVRIRYRCGGGQGLLVGLSLAFEPRLHEFPLPAFLFTERLFLLLEPVLLLFVLVSNESPPKSCDRDKCGHYRDQLCQYVVPGLSFPDVGEFEPELFILQAYLLQLGQLPFSF